MMLERISIIMEIVATGLIAIHFLLKRKKHAEIDQWLLISLKRKIVPRGRLRQSVWLIAGILTLIVMIGIAIWGFIKDFQGKAWPIGDLAVSYGLFVVAVIGGVLTVFFILWIHNKYFFKNFNPISLVITSSIIITFVCLLTLNLTATQSVKITSFLITYSFTTLIMALWLGLMPFFQKYLTIRSGVLIRFGLIIFFIAKIIQLTLIT